MLLEELQLPKEARQMAPAFRTVPVTCHVGKGFQMVSRAAIGENTIIGELDFPLPVPLSFADHFPGKPTLPGVMKMGLMFEAINRYCQTVSDGNQFPILTGVPLVKFGALTQPKPILVKVRDIFIDAQGGVANAYLGYTTEEGQFKEYASAYYTFELSRHNPSDNLPFRLENVEVDSKKHTISAIYNYTGTEMFPVDKCPVIPWPCVLESLGQTAIQIGNVNPIVRDGLFIVTHLRRPVFLERATAPSVLNLETTIEWTDKKRGLVHALATSNGKKVSHGVFGFAVIAPMIKMKKE